MKRSFAGSMCSLFASSTALLAASSGGSFSFDTDFAVAGRSFSTTVLAGAEDESFVGAVTAAGVAAVGLAGASAPNAEDASNPESPAMTNDDLVFMRDLNCERTSHAG